MKENKLTKQEQKKVDKIVKKQVKYHRRENLIHIIIQHFENKNFSSYEKGISPDKLRKKLFKQPEDEGRRLINKEIIKSAVRTLRLQRGFPLLCTRGKNNKGEFRYYLEVK